MESVSIQREETRVRVNEYVRSVYNWMAIGLAITGFIAYYVAHSEAMIRLVFGNPLIFYGLIIGELALVFSISARVNRMRASTATGLFLLYAALNGATLSFIFLAYAFVDSKAIVAALYILDHIFFNFAIAIRTYFQKVGDPRDIAPSMAVGFTINHVAAVVIPAIGGMVWISISMPCLFRGTSSCPTP